MVIVLNILSLTFNPHEYPPPPKKKGVKNILGHFFHFNGGNKLMLDL